MDSRLEELLQVEFYVAFGEFSLLVVSEGLSGHELWMRLGALQPPVSGISIEVVFMDGFIYIFGSDVGRWKLTGHVPAPCAFSLYNAGDLVYAEQRIERNCPCRGTE
jgi:hypothetical protein